jgi:ADP-ribose pyrophosphatase
MADPESEALPDERPRPWPRHGSEPGVDLLLFRQRWDLLENPRTGERMRRLVLETRSWVNVVAVNEHGDYVMVQQFRFGTEHVTTEVPGGVMDPGEEPLETAQRELREETGYTSERWTYLGAVEPNPAFQDNLCHHFLARDVRCTHPQELDDGEDIRIVLLTQEEIRAAVASGEINHALVLTALAHVLDLRTIPLPPVAPEAPEAPPHTSQIP